MKLLFAALFLFFQVQGVAPPITAFSIQGMTVNLEHFKGNQNVVLVFYRTEN